MRMEPASEALVDSQEAGQECSLDGCLTSTGTAVLSFPVEEFRKWGKNVRWGFPFSEWFLENVFEEAPESSPLSSPLIYYKCIRYIYIL